MFGEPLQSPYKELVVGAINNVLDTTKTDMVADALNSILNEYKKEVLSQLDDILDNLDQPSDKVSDIVDTAKEQINSISVDSNRIKETIDGIKENTQVDAMQQQETDLEALYNALKDKYSQYSIQDKYQYDSDKLASLNSIFDIAKDKKDKNTITKTDIKNASDALDAVKTKSTSSDIRPDKGDNLELQKDEAYGVLESDSILAKGSKLVVEVKVEMVEISIVKSYIDSAKLVHKFGELDSNSLNKSLKNQDVYGLLDIYLVDQDGNRISATNGVVYQIKVLLPEELRNRKNIRIVYKTENELEVFDVTREGNWLIFETDHLSYFYLLGDKTTDLKKINLWWLIILLLIIALFGLGVIAWKVKTLKDASKTNEQINANAILPLIASTTILIPTKAILAIIILSVIIVIEAIIIALLFLKGAKFFGKKDNVVEKQDKENTKVQNPTNDTVGTKETNISAQNISKEQDSTKTQESVKEQADIINDTKAKQSQLEITSKTNDASQQKDAVLITETEKIELIQEASDNIKAENKSQDKSNEQQKIVKTANKTQEKEQEKEKEKTFTTQKSQTIYNYSFQSRLHLNDKETDDKYNKLKNYLLSFDGVASNQQWKQETFTAKGKMVAKIRLQGKTIRVYLGVDPQKYINTKYNIVDNSNVKSHENTPSLMFVKGPLQLTHTLELIENYMQENSIDKIPNYKEQNFTVKKIKKEKLIEMNLIKIQNAEFIDSTND